MKTRGACDAVGDDDAGVRSAFTYGARKIIAVIGAEPPIILAYSFPLARLIREQLTRMNDADIHDDLR